MFRKNLLPLTLSILFGYSVAQGSPFGSWSAHGVVVNKTFRSTPLSHSLGVDGIYKLELRDEKNKIRRQMVTRSVFLAYEVGDEFNDLVPPKTRNGREEEQRMAAARAQNNALAQTGSDDSASALAGSKIVIKNRLASVQFTQDMLPETEGF